MIKVYYNRLENNKIEMTQDMLTDILSYTKRQENYIKRLKQEYIILQNASDEVEEEKDKEIERLNNIINNPEDLTLCKMWADTKLKEKNEELMSLYISERYVKYYYKSKVNKAIEYIENDLISFGDEYHWDNGCIEDYLIKLLVILKGVNKDED